MDDASFFMDIERIDAEFSAVPLVLRQLDVYHALVGREERDEAALECLRKISAWYLHRYGAESTWDGVIARQPLLVRGRVHILKVVHREQGAKDGLEELLEALNQGDCPVSSEEFRYLAMSSLEAHADFSALHNMEMRPSLFRPEQRALARRAWFDLRDASDVLTNSSDVQGTIVHSHEAAEKFLKIALLHEGHSFQELGKGKFRHNLVDITKALATKHSKYSYIKKQARDLHNLLQSMSARYSDLKRSLADATESFRLARHCCGFVAEQVQLDEQRGGPDIALRIGHYYHDYTGREYRFCGVKRNGQAEGLCQMFLLEAKDRGQTVDALINFKTPCSFHYLEIQDRKTIARLESRYSRLQHEKRLRTPHNSLKCVEIERVEESFHAVASIRMPIKSKI